MYRPRQRLERLRQRQGPKLEGLCQVETFLPMADHHASGCTKGRNVSAYVEGQVFLDVEECAPGASVWLTVEVSHDTVRWADLVRGLPIDARGYYCLPVHHLGAFLRVSYQVEGTVRFQIEWVGKSFAVGGATGAGIQYRPVSRGPRD